MRRYAGLLVVLAALALWAWRQHAPAPAGHAPPAATVPAPPQRAPDSAPAESDDARWPAYLPPEALDTLQRIARRGPFVHRQDGAVFQNRERLLPPRSRGYYHEYTVETPGSQDRGARRIIAGGDPPAEFFYSDDHYRSFHRFTAGRATR